MSIMQRIHQEETRIWTPEGNVPLDVIQAKRTIEDYDSNLTLGRHLLTGDWVIWLKTGPGSPPRPVIGLGEELPSADTIQERLRRADTRIHGDKILTQMRSENEVLERAQAAKSEDATYQAAEAYEWASRDIKGYSGRTANVKGRKRNTKEK